MYAFSIADLWQAISHIYNCLWGRKRAIKHPEIGGIYVYFILSIICDLICTWRKSNPTHIRTYNPYASVVHSVLDIYPGIQYRWIYTEQTQLNKYLHCKTSKPCIDLDGIENPLFFHRLFALSNRLHRGWFIYPDNALTLVRDFEWYHWKKIVFVKH